MLTFAMSCASINSVNRLEMETQLIGMSSSPTEERPLDYSFALYDFNAHPNPFSASFGFIFSLPKLCDATIDVYYFTGQHVDKLFYEADVGVNIFVWNKSTVSSGLYFAKLSACDSTRIIRFALIK